MHGVKRVMIFCVMTTILPTFLIVTPLYLRHSIFADVSYPVAESDVVAIMDGISSIFCESQTLRMNTSFNAFQLKQSPELSPKRKHIRLKKSMTLPDDTLEYWGFYLLKGATVSLKVCSRYEGSRLLVVRGEKNLRTCGLLDHNQKKFGATMDVEYKQVKVTFEHAQELGDVNELNRNNAAEEGIGTNADVFVKQRLNKSKKILKEPVHPKRHAHKKHLLSEEEEIKLDEIQHEETRNKRDINQILDGRIEHGGNAINYTKDQSFENSVSSFETDLLTCYDGSILLTQGFNPSKLCTDVHYLDRSEHMETIHEVGSDGYYYYIFYSDNDFITNDIHAVFDVYKPTYQYMNNSKDKECINVTECHFPIKFWSDERVIVEVPTHDGIEHEEDNIALLISTCHPRMGIYIVFPISVMFLILGCAFL
ncbi:PREDICTED: uncharacterized protein LOC108569400 isoform X2 [Nicrophorus vespilloides]|nr:PREDICTED: uncharacterized protein LOC108569400 isoform X2 [Nicrophorus vespilloides]